MKPMRSLRAFARAAGASAVTSWPSSRYLPSVGVSRSPSSASSVDLPQPEGPEMERNSPLRDVEVDAVERVRLEVVRVEDLGDAREADHGFVLHSSPFCS